MQGLSISNIASKKYFYVFLMGFLEQDRLTKLIAGEKEFYRHSSSFTMRPCRNDDNKKENVYNDKSDRLIYLS